MKNLFRNLYLIIIALLAAGIVLLTIFVSRGGFEEKNLRISVVISDSSADRWASFKEGLKLAAQDEGLDLKIVNTDRFESVEEELNLIDAEVSGGADALIVELSSSYGLEDYLEKLQTKVPVVLIENNVEGRDAMARSARSTPFRRRLELTMRTMTSSLLIARASRSFSRKAFCS